MNTISISGKTVNNCWQAAERERKKNAKESNDKINAYGSISNKVNGTKSIIIRHEQTKYYFYCLFVVFTLVLAPRLAQTLHLTRTVIPKKMFLGYETNEI